MNFNKLIRNGNITIPTHNLADSVDIEGGVFVWSGFVLVVKASKNEEKDISNNVLPSLT